jgi:DnaJ like chaperone protein
LGISPDASNEQIRSAYRKLAAQYHPDKVANLGKEFTDVAEEKFKLINEAYGEIRSQRGF